MNLDFDLELILIGSCFWLDFEIDLFMLGFVVIVQIKNIGQIVVLAWIRCSAGPQFGLNSATETLFRRPIWPAIFLFRPEGVTIS